MTWPGLAVSLISGLFGGAAWNAAWELWFRPRRDRKSIAQALTAEISGNVRVGENLLSRLVDLRERVPDIAPFSTMVFTSLAPRLGDVDVSALQDLIWLYRDIDYLNSFSDMSFEMRQSGIEQLRVRAERELAKGFLDALQQMLVNSILVREGLSKAATGTRMRPPVPYGIKLEGVLSSDSQS